MSGNANLRLDSRAKLDQIRIQSAVGSTYISTVTVRFADDSRQKVMLDKSVDPRTPMVQLALDRLAQDLGALTIVRSSTLLLGAWRAGSAWCPHVSPA